MKHLDYYLKIILDVVTNLTGMFICRKNTHMILTFIKLNNIYSICFLRLWLNKEYNTFCKTLTTISTHKNKPAA